MPDCGNLQQIMKIVHWIVNQDIEYSCSKNTCNHELQHIILSQRRREIGNQLALCNTAQQSVAKQKAKEIDQPVPPDFKRPQMERHRVKVPEVHGVGACVVLYMSYAIAT